MWKLGSSWVCMTPSDSWLNEDLQMRSSSTMDTIKINSRFSICIKEEGSQTLSLAPFLIATGR